MPLKRFLYLPVMISKLNFETLLSMSNYKKAYRLNPAQNIP